MSRRIFILLPSPSPTGPVKGGYALANALAAHRPVTLVTLREGSGACAPLDPRVATVSLAAQSSLRLKRATYRGMLREAGGRDGAASISMCLSADWLNAACRDDAFTCASVRGNLPRNYRGDYGIAGVPLALVHLLRLRAVDRVVAMNTSMAAQIRRISGIRVHVIPNFIDEAPLEPFRRVAPAAGPLRLVFLGSLSRRKQPGLALAAVRELNTGGVDCQLDIIGDGPLRDELGAEIARSALSGKVRMHGFKASPYDLLAAADALILPSSSEGTARACLEALHLGVPCVLRAIDGNSELVESAANGALFERDADLAGAVLRAARLSRERTGPRLSLLPTAARQSSASGAFLELLDT